MSEVLNILYECNNAGIYLWVDQGKLKFKELTQLSDSVREELFLKLKLNKDVLIDILVKNGIQSENLSLPIIYKDQDCHTAELSFGQERLWFIEAYESGTNAYNTRLFYQISKNISLDMLSMALEAVMLRHEALRTLIKTDRDGNAYQEACGLECAQRIIERVLDRKLTSLRAFIEAEANHIFNLEKEPPARVKVISPQDGGNNYLLVVIHHIAFDGWSIEVFLRDLLFYYEKLENSHDGKIDVTDVDFPPLSIQYKDFAIWQKAYLKSKKLENQLSFWKNKLSNYQDLTLITDKLRPSQVSYEGADVLCAIDKDTCEQLKSLARDLGVSLYSILLAGFNLFLMVYSNQRDILVGIPVANRHHQQLENLIGYFVNTVVLRSLINPEASLREYVTQVSAEIINVQLNQDVPFEKIVEVLQIQRDVSRHPVFQVMFELQDFNKGNDQKGIHNKQLFVRERSSELNLEDIYKVAQFDLSVAVNNDDHGLKINFNYAIGLYDAQSILLFMSTYQHILKCIALDSTACIKDFIYLDSGVYQEVVCQWNKTIKDYPATKTIQRLFEEQVLRSPNIPAIVYEDVVLSYQEFNEKANRLAHFIKENYSIKPDDLVAICLDRSEKMLISIMGILKSGGAYVPIDPEFPDDRVGYMLEDTKTKLILTNRIYQERFESLVETLTTPNKPSIIVIDEIKFEDCVACYSIANPITETTSRHLAYVIYTSGTTGKPKGVMSEHRGIANLITWMNDTYPLKEGDKLLQKTTYVFDDSVYELFWANWYGACVVFAKPDGHKDPEYLIDLMLEQSISIISFVPSMLSVFLEVMEFKSHSSHADFLLGFIPSLKYVLCSGEALPLAQVKQLQKFLPKAVIHNLYGPTEASVDVLYYDCTDKNLNAVYIGKAIYNTTAYVLNDFLLPVPVGAIGELYIGGDGLARGYLNRPELTQEKFIINPFQTAEELAQGRNDRLYKTGDLARWLPDGNLEYRGRNDFQIKIRGYRVELTEIEEVLGQCPGVKQCAVLAKERPGFQIGSSGHLYLVGYYVAVDQLEEEVMLHYMSTKLPEYMIPSILVHIERLPITVNGKLDRKALPEPELTNSENYISASTELEHQLVGIWAAVLGIPITQLSVIDDFFTLGGNSILAIKLLTRINNHLGLKLQIKDLFMQKERSIKTLAEYINKNSVQEDMDEYEELSHG